MVSHIEADHHPEDPAHIGYNQRGRITPRRAVSTCLLVGAIALGVQGDQGELTGGAFSKDVVDMIDMVHTADTFARSTPPAKCGIPRATRNMARSGMMKKTYGWALRWTGVSHDTVDGQHISIIRASEGRVTPRHNHW